MAVLKNALLIAKPPADPTKETERAEFARQLNADLVSSHVSAILRTGRDGRSKRVRHAARSAE